MDSLDLLKFYSSLSKLVFLFIAVDIAVFSHPGYDGGLEII